MKLEEFADIIGANIEITRYANQDGRFCVKFEKGSIKDGGCLRYTHGNADSYNGAARDYARSIKGQKLIIEDKTPRREFNVPSDLE